MIKKEIKYLEILELFNGSNFDEVEKRFGYKFLFYFIVSLYILVSLIGLFCFTIYSSIISFISGILFITIILLYLYILNQRIIKYFGEDCETFIKQNKLYWRGVRALIFFEKLQEKKIFDIYEKKILEIIDKELKLKKFNIFKRPVFLILLPIGSLLIDNIFEKLDLYWLLWCLFIFVIVFLFSIGIFKSLRTEKSKMEDLKFFVLWYKEIYPHLNKFKK